MTQRARATTWNSASARGRDWRSCPTACGLPARRPRRAVSQRHGRSSAYAGHLYPWKGRRPAARGAGRRCPTADGLIVGGHEREPDLARIKALAERLGVAARVTFTGLIDPPARFAAQLARADVLVLPNPASAISSRFTSPLKLFEYMAAGRPIVASRSAVAPRGAADGRERACWSRRATPPALAAGIRRLIDDPALAGRLAARRRAGRWRTIPGTAAPSGSRRSSTDVVADDDFATAPRARALPRVPRDAVARRRRGSPAAAAAVSTGASGNDFLDLRPSVEFAEQTKYLDEALHADARHERVSPPLLGSRIRNDMLRAFLAPDAGRPRRRSRLRQRPGAALERATGGRPRSASTSARSSPPRRGTGVDLLLGDLRRLPFADGTFTKAYSLDVLEHLSPEALRGMLAEAARVLAPGGALFVYTHVRKNAPIAAGLRWINALARRLERLGLIDMRQERLRKSDHLNPLADIPELEAVATGAGFRVARIRYYTPIVGGSSRTSACAWPSGRWRGRVREAAVGPRCPRKRPIAKRSAEARTAAKRQIANEPGDIRRPARRCRRR